MAEDPRVPENDTPEERDLRAAELALGLLDGDDRAAALRLRLSDPEFAAMVDAWRRRLEPLLTAYQPERPSENVWNGIVQRLEPRRTVIASGGSGRWRALALASSAIAATLAVFLILRPAPPQPQPITAVSVAQLTGDQEALRVVARYDGVHGTLALRSDGIQDPEKSPELWVIPADGKPRSLGLIARSGSSQVTVPVTLRAFLRDGATLAVTMEDAATAPHDAPSVAPIAIGSISVI
jgi:anti-sigma-K factor RskA